jgi:hypothetical protein
VDPLPARVRLVGAPGALRDVELEVFGWRTEHGETMVRCRLVDGSMGTIPARWTDLPRVGLSAEPLEVTVSPTAWRRLREQVEALTGYGQDKAEKSIGAAQRR